MEEVGAPTMVIHQKRDLPSFHRHHHNNSPHHAWNPSSWEWDPLRFLASAPSRHPPLPPKARRDDDDDGGDDAAVRLDLAGSAAAEARPSKRVRSASPASYPMCQVDNCREDLSGAKDYHRRHKVCEVHSKSTRAVVGSHPQRFCQQCSRFHLLSEFDDGRRSCRRRLAGHNRRRRKTHPDDPSASRLLLPADRDLLNILAAVARSQGKSSEGWGSLPDKDQLLQITAKINSLPLPADLAAKLRSLIPESQPPPAKPPSESTIDLLSHSGDKRSPQPTAGDGGGSSSSFQSPPMDDSSADCQLHLNLPLQLFSSSSPENDSHHRHHPPARNYFSSDSSVSPPCATSPPVVQTLFPMQTMAESVKSEKISSSSAATPPRPGTAAALDSRIPFDLFPHSVSVQAGYASSGSDHSPPSLNSDVQDRTERILFKLFDKDPSHFPGTLKKQIYDWLSNSPSEMESYIRPGCVVLSVYVSMPPAVWEQLQENLLQHLNALAQGSASDFWRSGRFLVHTGRQLASHKDGKFRLCKSWRTWGSPELISVSPLAVVGGQETSLVLRGRNLSNIGTKIHCTFMGGYTTKEVRGSTYRGTTYEEINLGGFKLHDASPSILGRCFIEVENGFKGNSFPVIIADASICKELRAFESVFDGEGKVTDVVTVDQSNDDARPRSKEEVLHFLNELGWLFQRKRASSFRDVPDYSLGRFKFLLTFSVERNCCSLIKTLLDILVERISDASEQYNEAVEMLSENQLLHRAVKRRSKSMVNLLVNYSVTSSNDGSKMYIFPPNQVGPGEITPLHLAASISGSDDVIDALTNDPQQIGLSSWNSLMDANGQSPYSYASMTNNESYNKLVARKLADRINGQITVTIGNETSEVVQRRRPCAKCAVVARRCHKRVPGAQGLLQRPYIHSMLAIAAVCVCVCLFLRGLPDIGSVAPFKWENLDFGTI